MVGYAIQRNVMSIFFLICPQHVFRWDVAKRINLAFGGILILHTPRWKNPCKLQLMFKELFVWNRSQISTLSNLERAAEQRQFLLFSIAIKCDEKA